MHTWKPQGKPIAIGAAAGVINGLFGAGGGLLLVPLFMSWCRLPPKDALATSLAVTLPLSVVSAAVYWFRGTLDFEAALPYMLGGIVGGLIGAAVMGRLQVKWLRLLLAGFLLYGGVKGVMLW
ncbi:MAG: TSUP family transporter [Clostridia bacterium]|nr:TSUP family transporter [Clostridia bacterium]